MGDVPIPRSGHRSVIIDQLLYVFGGSPAKGEYLNDIHFYDITSKQWSAVETSGNCPSPRTGMSFFAFKKEIIKKDIILSYFSFLRDMHVKTWK